jgi:hypothetical protein
MTGDARTFSSEVNPPAGCRTKTENNKLTYNQLDTIQLGICYLKDLFLNKIEYKRVIKLIDIIEDALDSFKDH